MQLTAILKKPPKLFERQIFNTKQQEKTQDA